jgi:hypothetical protein
MEAHKLDPPEYQHFHDATKATPCDFDQPFSWRGLIGLIHPYVWALIAALWLGLACLLLFEAR